MNFGQANLGYLQGRGHHCQGQVEYYLVGLLSM